MSKSPLRSLSDLGVAVSYDNIGRDLITSGELARMVAEDAVVGITANPIIYQAAVTSTSSYDDEMAELASKGYPPDRILMEMWASDVAMAADVLRPAYESSNHVDGYVSIELTPHVAHDTAGTVAAAHEMWQRIGRPNIALKIPSTPESFGAIEQCTADGINVNATVIFATETYESVARSYLAGLRQRHRNGSPLDLTSYASIFISRYDAPVDELLLGRARETADPAELKLLRNLLGRAAIATAWEVYRKYSRFFGEESFGPLRAAGARPQRPLWAGVVTRNSRYGDVRYVEALSIPGTVLTISDPPFRAFKDHGVPMVATDSDEHDHVLAAFARAGINLTSIGHQMEEQVVALFTEAFDQLVAAIDKKTRQLAGVTTAPV